MRWAWLLLLLNVSCADPAPGSGPLDAGRDLVSAQDGLWDRSPLDVANLEVDQMPTNQDQATGAAAAPKLSPAPGAHLHYAAIALTTTEEGAAIHYTTDGSTPTAASRVYKGPLRLTSRLSGATLRAITVVKGKAPSAVTAGTYTRKPGMVVHFQKPASWTSPHIHYWKTTPSNLSTAWPGKPMLPEGQGWYYLHLVGEAAMNIVFSDKGGAQTTDQKLNRTEGWYDRRGDWWDMDPELLLRFAWPGGKFKAVVMSYDDGVTQDKKLAAMFSKHGMVGTFNVNSGKLGQKNYLQAAEIKVVYAGHEVATHSVTHPHLTSLTAAQINQELADDRKALEKLTGGKVRGHAYPFGSYNDAVIAEAKKVGLVYGRVVPQTKDLRLPSDLFRWRGTCHHTCAWSGAQALVSWSKQQMALLYVWGHSWELDGNKPANSWAHMEALCTLVGGKKDTWYARNVDVADYLNALRQVKWGPELQWVKSDAKQPVWIKDSGGKVVQLKPGATLAL